MAEGCLCIFSNVFGVLADFADFHRVVWTISHDEVRALSSLIEVILELNIAHAVNLYWAWISLFLIEIFSKELWKHFVDTDVSQKQIVVSQQLAFVLELPKVSLKPIKANDLSNARDVHIFNLLSKVSLWILHDHANTSVKLV